MKYLLIALTLVAGSFSQLAAAGLTGFPFTDEDLSYSINWPSGLSLGESHLHARHSGANWNFELTIDAGIPGFLVKDRYSSISSPDFCSTSLQRDTAHGAKRAGETETISGTTVTRTGGRELTVPSCVKDALTFLFYARRELGQGRVPEGQQILLGGLYPIRLEYAGEQTVKVGEQSTVSDKIICSVSTASSGINFEVYFARDAARTPLIIRVPFSIGTFSMELVH
jgi:hypothetical protein